MSDWSRRRALQVVASTAVAALAGCNARTSDSDSLPSVGSENVVTDYEVRRARNAAGDPVFGPADAEEETGTPRRVGAMGHLTDASDLDEWAFAGTDEASALRSFVVATDFETRSVLLYQREVPACHDVRLVSVTRESDSVHADLCRTRKPADVACDRDDVDVTAIAIRLPFAGDSFDGYGSGTSTSCDRRARPLDFDGTDADATANATEAGGETRVRSGAGALGRRGGR